MRRILVTNAGGRLGISLSRALKAAPESFHLIGVDAHEVQLHRAVTHEKHLVPRADEADFLPVLRDIIEDTQPVLLWLNHEAEIAQISKVAHEIGVKTFLPSYETIALCQDKMAFNRRLQEAGVPAPRSMLIETRDDLQQAFRELGPQLWLRAIRGTGGKGSLPTSDFEAATKWIDLHNGWGNFMAAPRLTSNSVTWESIWDRGELLAAQGRRRLYWDFTSLTLSGVTGIGGGHRWVNELPVSQAGLQAVKAIDPQPHGLLSVDMVYDSQGMPQVTEINAGRFMSGGVVCVATADYNLPYLVFQTALGERPSSGLPMLDRVSQDTLLVHGVDMEPLFVPVTEVEGCADELRRRRSAITSNAAATAGRAGVD